MQELTAILQWKHADRSVLLIDDARLFLGYEKSLEYNYYPSIQELREIVCMFKPDFKFENIEDIMRIYRKEK